MPTFNPLTFACCCKSRWRGSSSSASPRQDTTALESVQAPNLPPAEQQEEIEAKRQNPLMGLSDMAWAVPEYQSSIEIVPVAIQHIGSDSDSDSDSFDSDHDIPPSTKKSGTAFGAVRRRIIRSISHNTSSDQPSRVSVGNSEEEVTRRAELRRIMRLRIQDQLDSDEAEDQFENKPTNSVRRKIPSAGIALPISGPRDAIKFGVSNSSSNNEQSTQLDPQRGYQCTLHDPAGFRQSTIIPETDSSKESSVVNRNDVSAEDAVIPMPSPVHLSAHISLTEDMGLPPSQKSFQLYNSFGRLDRILGPDNSFNSRQASSGDGQSALGVWLIAQGLRSRDSSTLYFDDGEGEEEEEAENTIFTKITTYNSPIVDRGRSPPAYKPQTKSKKADCLEEGSTLADSPSKLDLRCQAKLDIPKDLNDNSALSEELPWGPTVRALLSSFTDNTSSDPSQSSSNPAQTSSNLYKLDLKDLERQSHDSSKEPGNLNNQNYKPPNLEATYIRSHSQGVIGDVQLESETRRDAASTAHSEFVSKAQRKAELETIKKRFSETVPKSRSERMVIIRSREDFSHLAPRSPAKESSRDNIHPAIPATHFRAKSEGSLYSHGGDHRDVPQTQNLLLMPREKMKIHEKETSNRSKRRSNMSIRPHMSRLPTEENTKSSLERHESATDLWQRAIRLEAESRHSSSLLNTPNPDRRSLSFTRSPNRTGVARNSNSTIYNMRQEISQLTPSTDERSSPTNSKWLIERWVSQMRPRSVYPTESVTSTRLVGPPKSWSNFPSFNREERNRNVTSKDKVQPRDFAVKHVSSGGQIRWATDMVSQGDEQHAHTLPRSLSTKFGELVKSKMSRMKPSKALRHRVGQALTAKSATPTSAHMEYPEMGIRPSESGYTEIQVLGREINYIKGQVHLKNVEKDLLRPHSSRSLGDKVVELMHEAIGQRHPKHDEPFQPADIPMVPVTPSLVGQSIAATTTDVFTTPKSHLSNGSESSGEEGEATAGYFRVREQEVCPVMSEKDRVPSNPVFAASIAKVDHDT
ncbi:hypothetical protein FLONG3_6700 [Fusarium longipes]|uniref:Uncharacterized protein n=1 Tax=Fusarium longipes TaxID=694270 RepID=A0A395SKW0_9HYPO|nr:hypothetical protein FLONG3_6700 [Fusarium longipes]